EHLGAGVHARRARLQHRDERRMPCEDADLAGRPGDDQHLSLALERRALRRDERDVEAAATTLRQRYAASASGSGSSSGSGSASAFASSPEMPFAFSTACSIGPTM